MLGGHSSNLMTGKPKNLRNFRKLKRKKLYHPKKYYVRIQIPRKEYFYRSTVGLQSPILLASQRMEWTAKGEAKVRSPDLAAARSKTSSIRNEAAGGNNNEDAAVGLTTEYVKGLKTEFAGGESAENFEQRVSAYVASNWPVDQTVVSFEEVVAEKSQEEGQNLTVSENQLEAGTYCSSSGRFDGGPDWGGLIEYLGTTIGEEHCAHHLAIDPENDVPPIVPDERDPVPASQNTLCQPGESVNTTLMEGIDLHLELQNYLKAIEGFHGNKNPTKTTLQCNFYDNHTPIKIYSSGQDLQNRAEEFYDVSENKSGSSFDSAASNCAELEETPNEVFLNVSTDPEVATKLESEQKPETEDHTKKVKSDEQPETDHVNNSVKRTSGMTSFRQNGKTWESNNRADIYEKIQPYRTDSTRKCRQKSSVLYKNTVCTLSAESVPQSIRKAASDTKQKQFEPTPSVTSTSSETSSDTESVAEAEAEPEPEPEAEEKTDQTWSPTLTQLIEIYNSVLKQNAKLRQDINSRSSMGQRSSSQLFNFLIDKLKEKHYKADLINLSQDIRDSYRPDNFRSTSGTMNEYANVVEYVAMFQEILNSSLSIDQIARLNNLISGLQDFSEKNYSRIKELEEETRKASIESFSKKSESEQPKKLKPKIKKRVRFQNTTASKTNLKKWQKIKPKPPKTKPKKVKKIEEVKRVEEVQRIEVPPSTDLESILKIRFGAEWNEGIRGKEKVLVTVKLSGNKVLVNGLAYFENEDALPKEREKVPQKGMTELIIENVTKDQIGKSIWYKNTKSSKLRFLKRPKKEEKVKTPTKKHANYRKFAAEKPKETKKNAEKSLMQFQYDQLQLKSQHPMEAIAEMSESKLTEDDQRKSEPPPEMKILLQDIPANPAAMKQVLKEALEERVYSKDLVYDFGWSEQEIGRTGNRIGTVKQQSKRRPTPKKKKKAAAVRSMVDLKKRPKSTKEAPMRPRSTYMCYSSMQHLRDRKKMVPQSWNSSPATPKTKKPGEHPGKKTSKAVLRRKKSDPVTCRSQTEAIESLADTSLYLDAEETDPIQLLYSEATDGVLTGSQKKGTKNESDNLQETESCVTCLEEKTMEIPIAFISEATNNDGTSFLAEMIHSDSFLANMSQSKLRSLFQCSSEIKFYPGRLTDSGNETMPLVKFVLTPSQNERANLPPDQVEVVAKGNVATYNLLGDKEEDSEAREKTLKSIEEFIKYLSKFRKTEAPETIENKDNNDRTTAPGSQPKSKSPAPAPTLPPRLPPPPPPAPARRPFHECQRRKLVEMKDQQEKARGKENKNLQKKGKVDVSDVFVNKMVVNLSKALKNLKPGDAENYRRGLTEARKRTLSPSVRNRTPSPAVRNRTPSPAVRNRTPSPAVRKQTSSPVANLKKQSNEIQEKTKTNVSAPPEFQKVVNTAIARAVVKAITRANARTKASLEKEQTTVDVGNNRLEKKTIKINIRYRKSNSREEENPEGSSSQQGGEPTGEGESLQEDKSAREIDLLDSLVSRENRDLGERRSTYFDAVEERSGGGDDQMPGSLMPSLQVAEGDMNVNAGLGAKEKGKSQPPPTASDQQPLSNNRSEEIMFDKISKALEEGEVSYSMALLDDFLNKSENSDCAKLRKLLMLVENKSTNIMKNMEKAAWLRVLSLLEKASQVFESEGSEDSRKSQLKTVKDFIEKIHSMNIRRLVDLQKFISTMMRTSESDVRHGGNVFNKIKDSLVTLKQFIEEKLSGSSTLVEPEKELAERESGIRIHSTLSLPDIKEDVIKETRRREEERQARELKRKLRQQYNCLEQLLSCEKDECELVPAGIQDVKKKVAEKMKALEKAFRSCDLGETSVSAATSWSRATSILSIARSYRGGEAGTSTETPAVPKLSRTPGYVDLMKGLLKAWDTRMTLNTISGENYR